MLRDLIDVFFADVPIELYRFSLGGTAWGYAATGDSGYSLDNTTYAPEYIVRTRLHYSSDFARDVLTVTVPADNAVANVFFSGTPEYQMRLSLLRGGYHNGGFTQIWTGTVNGASFDFSGDAYTCDLTCETLASRMERQGLARCYQLTCPHTLYGNRCRVNPDAFAIRDTVTMSSSVNLTVAGSYAPGWFSGGHLVCADGVRRYIISSDNHAFSLERSLSVPVGSAITLYPGCDKSRGTCAGKFGNGINFGGFPWLPIENPFTSSIG